MMSSNKGDKNTSLTLAAVAKCKDDEGDEGDEFLLETKSNIKVRSSSASAGARGRALV
jgi:hypothetical protein